MWKRSYLSRWREPGVESKGVRGQENIRDVLRGFVRVASEEERCGSEVI